MFQVFRVTNWTSELRCARLLLIVFVLLMTTSSGCCGPCKRLFKRGAPCGTTFQQPAALASPVAVPQGTAIVAAPAAVPPRAPAPVAPAPMVPVAPQMMVPTAPANGYYCCPQPYCPQPCYPQYCCPQYGYSQSDNSYYSNGSCDACCNGGCSDCGASNGYIDSNVPTPSVPMTPTQPQEGGYRSGNEIPQQAVPMPAR